MKEQVYKDPRPAEHFERFHEAHPREGGRTGCTRPCSVVLTPYLVLFYRARSVDPAECARGRPGDHRAEPLLVPRPLLRGRLPAPQGQLHGQVAALQDAAEFIFNNGGVFPVRRGHHDEEAFKTAHAILERGGIVVMYAEAGRSRSGELGKPRHGLGRLALESGAHGRADRDRRHRARAQLEAPAVPEGHGSVRRRRCASSASSRPSGARRRRPPRSSSTASRSMHAELIGRPGGAGCHARRELLRRELLAAGCQSEGPCASSCRSCSCCSPPSGWRASCCSETRACPEPEPVEVVPGDPWAYEPSREDELRARAAAGHSHVLYEKSPGGVEASAARTARWRPQIERAAEASGVDADLIEGMVLLESAGRPEVMASDDVEGAVGLTQILAETGSSLLGMRVDVEESRRLTRRIRRADREGHSGQSARLRERRAAIDERFDPEAALAGTGRYLRDRAGGARARGSRGRLVPHGDRQPAGRARRLREPRGELHAGLLRRDSRPAPAHAARC